MIGTLSSTTVNRSMKALLLTLIGSFPPMTYGFAASTKSTCFMIPRTLASSSLRWQQDSSRYDSSILMQPQSLSSTTSTTLQAISGDFLSSSSVIAASAELDSWVQPVVTVLGPTLNFLAFAMLCRVILSWYPTQNVNAFPLNVVAWPTEPLLKILRPIIPPAFGVDITPIVWFGIFTFLNEILLGQQGLFTMKIKYWS